MSDGVREQVEQDALDLVGCDADERVGEDARL